jgi:hypothetical protein
MIVAEGPEVVAVARGFTGQYLGGCLETVKSWRRGSTSGQGDGKGSHSSLRENPCAGRFGRWQNLCFPRAAASVGIVERGFFEGTEEIWRNLALLLLRGAAPGGFGRPSRICPASRTTGERPLTEVGIADAPTTPRGDP